jgi:hypothetical protein
MTDSLRALLSGAIDYAGMFPPASLSLAESLSNWRKYCGGPNGWMLGPFVCQIGHLPELRKVHSPKGDGVLAIIVGAAATGSEKMCVQEQVEEWLDLGVVEALEFRWPDELLRRADRKACANHVKLIAIDLRVVRLTKLYFESPTLESDDRRSLDAAVAALADYKKTPLTSSRPAGMKFRTGGQLVPSPKCLASLICACRDAGIFWKATAGLHHAVANFDHKLGAQAHGFLNVFSAAVLADVHGLDAAQVERILEDQEASHFCFAGDKMSWHDLNATVDQIAAARRRSLRSFGSCSFDEPVADLRSLGLLA